MSARRLDPLAVELRGQVLVEASAGTGKTFTLTTLYLRLLLERGLTIDQILVVTFTEAATEELRDRIRTRLQLAAGGLTAGGLEPLRVHDRELAELLERLPDRTAAPGRVEAAVTSMDEAAIHTIHGFCQRALRDHAFEGGVPFAAEVVADDSLLRHAAAADFWRQRVCPAAAPLAALARARWRTPAGLLAALDPTLALDDVQVLPAADPTAAEALCRRLEDSLTRWQSQWRATGAEAAALLRDSPALNRNSYSPAIVERVVRLAHELAAAGPAALLGGSLREDFERLSADRVARAVKKGRQAPQHPVFDCSQQVCECLRRWCDEGGALLAAEARAAIRAGVERRKRDERLLHFDDLLRRLDLALRSEGGAALAERLRSRFPVALVDEFQDTDPQQYRIFRQVYAGHPECALLLIGDPKQAIYAFRGADVFTYMRARADTDARRRFTLGVNWRASPGLVTAVNALFAAPNPFLFAPDIGFAPAAGRQPPRYGPLLVDGVPPAPLQFWWMDVADADRQRHDDGRIRSRDACQRAATACARRIASLLNLADAGRAEWNGRPLCGGDIAVLVRTHREGEHVQRALAECAVASVTLSQDSVFLTEDAEELACVMDAVAFPGDQGRVRAALATALLGWDAEALERLAGDEGAWEGVLQRFEQYRSRWAGGSFLAAFEVLLAGEHAAARLKARADGERRLTNLLQLAELLEQAAGSLPGVEGLRRWLAAQRTGGRVDAARQLRLESDEGLVQVVTVHKSKGLEYPIVFIPFAWSGYPGRGPAEGSAPVLFHEPPDWRAGLDLGSPRRDANQARAATESLAERVRLLYVAVTRAVSLCVLCWGPVRDAEDTALAHLLGLAAEGQPEPTGGTRPAAEGGREALARLAATAQGQIAVLGLPHPEPVRWTGPPPAPPTSAPAPCRPAIDVSWRVVSYSGLVRGQSADRPDHDALPGEWADGPGPGAAGRRTSQATPVVDGLGPPAAASPEDEVFRLPAGSQVGTCLHGLLAGLDFPQAHGQHLAEAVHHALDSCGRLATDGQAPPLDWVPAVTRLVSQALDTELPLPAGVPGKPLRLRSLERGHRLDELEFHFPVDRLELARLRRLLAAYPRYRHAADGLREQQPLRGLIRGFIDLVWRHGGRYWVADYKSNYLGDRLEDYGPPALEQAMQEHRYDLQALIYTVAVHRYLRRRVPDYRYDSHFGGAYYLFLRGMRPGQGCLTGVWCDRPDERLVDGVDRLFGAVGGPAP